MISSGTFRSREPGPAAGRLGAEVHVHASRGRHQTRASVVVKSSSAGWAGQRPEPLMLQYAAVTVPFVAMGAEELL